MRRSIASLVVILSAAGIARGADPAEDAIHACPDGQGGIVYQGDPCIDPPPTRRVAVPARSRPRPAPPAAVARATPPPSAPEPAFTPPPPRPLVPYRGDPRWATPRSTWETFAEAMRRGDRALALACLGATAGDGLAARISGMGPEEMRAAVDGLGGIADEGDLGPFWSLRILRRNARPKWVLFERAPVGAFKIAAM